MNPRNVLLAGALGMGVMTALVFLLGKPARSQESQSAAQPETAPAYFCPPNTRCKILILTEQEEQTLVAPNAILDLARWANRSAMGDLTDAWREKIKQAPYGKPLEIPKPEASKP